MTFDPNLLRVRAPPAGDITPRSPPRHQGGERFLKGPIPWNWLTCAMGLRGKALHVAMVLWHHAGLQKSRHVAVSMSAFVEFGISRFTAARGLAALEAAGLVAVERHAGRKPRVRLNDAPSGEVAQR